jgi:hypothetical protein
MGRWTSSLGGLAFVLGLVYLGLSGEVQAGPLSFLRHGRHHCPKPAYSKWNYWAAGVTRWSTLIHHHPYYEYPSDRYSHLPATYVILPYACPPVAPQEFYEVLHQERRALAPHYPVAESSEVLPTPRPSPETEGEANSYRGDSP